MNTSEVLLIVLMALALLAIPVISFIEWPRKKKDISELKNGKYQLHSNPGGDKNGTRHLVVYNMRRKIFCRRKFKVTSVKPVPDFFEVKDGSVIFLAPCDYPPHFKQLACS